MTQPKTAIVFGASGYTGRAVVPELRRRGFDVVAHIRPDSSRLEALRPEFEAVGARVDTTPWDAKALSATVTTLGPTLAFGLLGITAAGAKREARRRGGAAPTYETVDYALTVMAIDACVAAGTSPRFVYLSSMGVKDGVTGAYLVARLKCERYLQASGLPYTIARPSFITGEGRDEARPGEAVGAAVVDAGLGVLGALGARRLQKRFSSRSNAELANALIDAATDAARANRVLESEEL